MAKFIFRLQSFLNLKGKLENQKKMEYGQAIATLEQEKNKKKALIKEQSTCILSFKKMAEEKIDPYSFQRFNDYLEVLKKRIKIQEQEIVKAEAFVEQKRLELIEAMKERKMLDKLREKALEDYMIEEQKADQKRVDEIVSYQYNKQDS